MIELRMPSWLWSATLIAFVTIAGCDSRGGHSDQDHSPVKVESLRRAVGGEPVSLDPGQAADSFSYEVLRDLYEGLVAESADGELQPGVAASWSVDSTGTEYSFHLRNTAKWSNGARVRAEEFVTAWRRIVDPKQASPDADLLRPIAHAAEIIGGRLPATELGAYAVGDDILVVHLSQPAPYFTQLLTHSATFPIFSEEAARARSSSKWISNGPYVLSTWIPGAGITLRRNTYYWDRSNTKISEVEYVPISDENSELNRYRAGQLDITQTVPASALPLIRKEYPRELLVAPFLGTAYYAINLHSTTFASNLELRQALAMSIDRHALEATILVFGQTPAYGFVPPGTWNYESQSWAWKDLPDAVRIAEARDLYRKAGYSNSNPLHLRLLMNASPAIRKMAIAITTMWRETLGVQTELTDEEYRVFLDSRKDTARWEIVRLGWVADYNDAGNFLDIFRTGSPGNDPSYSNAEFDYLLDTAAATSDAANRKEILEHAERLMLSDYPIIPIYFYSSKRLIKPYVKGARTNPLNRLYSKHLSLLAN